MIILYRSAIGIRNTFLEETKMFSVMVRWMTPVCHATNAGSPVIVIKVPADKVIASIAVGSYSLGLNFLYRIRTTVVMHETGFNVVVIHPLQYYNPFAVIHRSRVLNSHLRIHWAHLPPASIQPHPSLIEHFGDTGPGSEHSHGPSTDHGGPGLGPDPDPERHHNH